MESASSSPRRFLTAHWRHLVMLNFDVDPAVVQPFVPHGTEIDFWQGRTFVSLVGFRFEDTRVLGVPIPWHRDFDEVNLRCYVCRRLGDEMRRGVIFVKEIVPRRLIAWVARTLYNENYVAVPMKSRIEPPAPGEPRPGEPRPGGPSPGKPGGSFVYEWFSGGRWHGLTARVFGEPQALVPGSEEEFITEHYWGYARQPDGAAVEYGVEHPPWRVWRATAQLDCDVASLYGAQFAACLAKAPSSAFVADGSAVVVRRGRRLG
jgi:uncharacterized protein YqjF (DUF2071 family)